MPADKRRSLLLVHMRNDDREMYAEYLRFGGFDVLEVGTTDAALPLVKAVDVIVTGLMIPGSMTVAELIERVRRDRRDCRKPIIVVTACVVAVTRQAAIRAGSDALLLKPCLPDVLLREVQRLLNAPPSPSPPPH